MTGLTGLIGDVHAEEAALEYALEWLRDQGVQWLLCVGDIADGRGSANRCVELLTEAGVITVRGNHDRWLLQGSLRDLEHATEVAAISRVSRDWLAELPVTRAFDTAQGRLLLCHGLGEDDMAYVTPDDRGYAIESNTALQALITDQHQALVVCGHSHRRLVRHFGDLIVINAGTLIRDQDPGFGVLDLNVGAVRFFDFTSRGKVESVARVTLDGPDWPGPG